MREARLESPPATGDATLARALEVNRLLHAINTARRRGVEHDPLVHRAALMKATELAGLFARSRKKRTAANR